MKKILLPFAILSSLSLALQCRSASADNLLKENDNVAICGDSITEQKRYSVLIEDYLIMCQSQRTLQAHQFGWSGEKADALLRRMGSQVIPFKPSVATICYGMNDGLYAPTDPKVESLYRTMLKAIVDKFKAAGVRTIVVGSPGVVDSKSFDTGARKSVSAEIYNKTLAGLASVAKSVAQEEGVQYADVNGVMATFMEKTKTKYGESFEVAGPDGIHPAMNGHLAMAYAFLKALGCDGSVGNITFDVKAQTATASDGHKVLKTSTDSIDVESTRYPFCFFGNKKNPESTIYASELLPFNDDLNRFTLIVTNGDAKSYKVTFGDHSKTFSTDALKVGINLAAEFEHDNPFSQPFENVEAAIEVQQGFETPAVKQILNFVPGWEKLIPEQREALHTLQQAVMEKDALLVGNVRGCMHPVTYTIKIEKAD